MMAVMRTGVSACLIGLALVVSSEPFAALVAPDHPRQLGAVQHLAEDGSDETERAPPKHVLDTDVFDLPVVAAKSTDKRALDTDVFAPPQKRALEREVFDKVIKRKLDGDVFDTNRVAAVDLTTARRAIDVDVFDTPIKATKNRRKLDTDVFARRAIDTDVFDEQAAPPRQARRPLDSDVFR